jgi:hypothetical protein
MNKRNKNINITIINNLTDDGNHEITFSDYLGRKNISTFVYNILMRFEITSFDRFIAFYENELQHIKYKVGRSTVNDLKDIYRDIIYGSPDIAKEITVDINVIATPQFDDIIDTISNDIKPTIQISDVENLQIYDDILIPDDLKIELSIFTLNALKHLNIASCLDLLKLNDKDFVKLKKHVGESVVEELQLIHQEITNRFPILRNNYHNSQQTEVISEILNNKFNPITKHEIIEKNDTEIDSTINDFTSDDVTIPKDLLRQLMARSLKYLEREQITTCKKLLSLTKEDILRNDKIGNTTVNDLLNLQNKVAYRFPMFGFRPDELRLYSVPEVIYFQRKHRSLGIINSSDSCAEWSILNYTLPNIFNVDFSFITKDNFDNEGKTIYINNEYFSDQQINILRNLEIFIHEDTANIYNLSISYLIREDINDELLFKLLDLLAYQSGYKDRSSLRINNTYVSDSPILSGVSIDVITNLLLIEYSIPSTLKKILGTMTWGEVALLSERKIIEIYGFNRLALDVIKCLWSIRDRVSKFNIEMSAYIQFKEYDSFNKLMDKLISSVAKKEHDFRILKHRFGLINGKVLTLRAIQKNEVISVQRVAQIETTRMKLLRKKYLSQLNNYWQVLSNILIVNRGVVTIAEIAEYLTNSFRWKTTPDIEALRQFININNKFQLQKAPLRVIFPEHQCINCSKIKDVLSNELDTRSNRRISFADATKCINAFCGSQECGIFSKISTFSTGYLHHIIDNVAEININNSIIIKKERGDNKAHYLLQVEDIIRNSDKPLTFMEIIDQLHQLFPFNIIKQDKVYERIKSLSNVYRLDNDTYMSSDNILIPKQLFIRIENYILNSLNIKPSMLLSVSDVFENYAASLREVNITDNKALYAYLKKRNSIKLQYPVYPYVIEKTHDFNPEVMKTVVERYILSLEGLARLQQITDFVYEQFGIDKKTFLYEHLDTIENVFHVSREKYIHIQCLKIEKEHLIPIVDNMRVMLREVNLLYASTIFQNNLAYCKKIGLTTPRMLIEILKRWYSDQFIIKGLFSITTKVIDDNPRNIMKYKKRKPGAIRKNSFMRKVSNFIDQYNGPCPLSLLHDKFADDPIYRISILTSINLSNSVLRYDRGLLISLSALEWSDEKQEIFENLAHKHLQEREKSGYVSGLSSILYISMRKKLPKLPNNIKWTQTLIKELFSLSSRYCLIKHSKDNFISIQNKHNIKSLIDYICYILATKCNGSVTMSNLVAMLKESGILKKNLTLLMLQNDDRIIVKDDIVRLADFISNTDSKINQS